MSESVDEKMGSTHPLTNSSTHSHSSEVIIQVKHLSKRYQIGMDRTYKTFCESAVNTVKSPLKRLKSFSRQEEVFWALKDINFEVHPGEVVGIIGRNGAGKTTLLKVLSRITHPTEGEIILRGRVASLLEVGTGFHPELTGRENIYFNGAILGMTKQEIEDKFDEIVEFSGVKEFLDTPLKRYSSGMQVRLAFAVAAHLEPEILMVDEVLAVGDAEFQKKCLGKMREVAKGGRTILFVSHNMAAVRALCTRVILLQNGRKIYDGSPTTVISQYFQTFARDASNSRLQFETIDSKAQIREVKLTTDLAPDNTIDYTSPISFEVNCEVKEPCSGIYMGINVYNGYEERLIFWRDIELLPELWGPREAGTYIYRITIPGHVLSPGPYRLDIALVELLSSQLLHLPQEFLTFEVSDHQSVRRAKNLPWKGLTSISLDLNVTYHPNEYGLSQGKE
jgi:lipopolysaccharide transport system ATP-binding protein